MLDNIPTATLHLPEGYDALLIKELAELQNPWGYAPNPEGGVTLTFRPEQAEAVNDAVEAHDGVRLERAKAGALARLAAFRWGRTQSLVYDGVRTAADPAIAVITGKLTLRQIAGVPDETEDKWKLADGEFRSWDRAAIVQFGMAVAMHIQACFDHEASLTEQIVGAADLAALEAIDTGAGWPE